MARQHASARMVVLVSLVAAMLLAPWQPAPARTAWASVANAQPNATFPPAAFLAAVPETNHLAIIDPATGEMSGIYNVPGGPLRLLANPFQPLVYAAINGGNAVEAFNLSDHHVVGTASLPSAIRNWSYAPSRQLILTADGSSMVRAVSVDTFSVTMTFQFSAPVGAVTVVPNSRMFFATQQSTNRVAFADIITGKVLGDVFAGLCNGTSCDPQDVAASPDGKYIFALGRTPSKFFAWWVVVIDASSDRVIAKTQLSSGTIYTANSFMGLDRSTSKIWIVGGPHDGHFAAMSMQPPFGQTDMTGGHAEGISRAAFSPTGEGFGSGEFFARAAGVFNGQVTSFPSLSQRTALWAPAEDIIYEP